MMHDLSPKDLNIFVMGLPLLIAIKTVVMEGILGFKNTKSFYWIHSRSNVINESSLNASLFFFIVGGWCGFFGIWSIIHVIALLTFMDFFLHFGIKILRYSILKKPLCQTFNDMGPYGIFTMFGFMVELAIITLYYYHAFLFILQSMGVESV